MEYLSREITARAGALVEVTLDRQANVRLMDPSNYLQFQRGQEHRYLGGQATASPVRLQVPSSGSWYLVIDLGGAGGNLHHGVRVIE